MANLFLASEILEINIAEEHNGAAFYQAVADVTKNKNLKKTLLEISAQEKNHENRFTELLQQVEVREPEETYPGELDAYIKSLQGGKMFEDEDHAILLAKSKTDKEALEFALRTEQATLDLLNELKKHIDISELPFVELTIEEEEEHVEQLNELLGSLEK